MRNHRKRKQEAVIKTETSVSMLHAENVSLRKDLVFAHASITMLQAERDLHHHSLASLKTEVDLAHQQAHSFSYDLVKQIDQAVTSEFVMTRTVSQLEKQLKKAEQKASEVEAAAAEKYNLAAGKEVLVRETERELAGRELVLKRDRKILKGEQKKMKKDFEVLREAQRVTESKEVELNALLEGLDGGSVQELRETDSERDVEQVNICKGLCDLDFLTKAIDTKTFPRKSESTVLVKSDGTVELKCQSLNCDRELPDEDTGLCKPCAILKRNLSSRKSVIGPNAGSVLVGEEALNQKIKMLPLDDRKSVAVKICCAADEMGFLQTDAALFAANVVGCGEKSVRRWKTDWIENEGEQFTSSKRGKHSKIDSPFDDAAVCALAKDWVKNNAVRKGEGNMTVADFLQFCNTDLLSDWIQEHKRGPFSLESARSWLQKLGFSVYSHKRGLYKDGHDDPDAVACRKEFVREMIKYDELHAVPLPVYDSDGFPNDDYEEVLANVEQLISDQRRLSILGMKKRSRKSVEIEQPELIDTFPHPYLQLIPGVCLDEKRLIVYAYQDESICHANDSQNQFWGETGGTPNLKPKTEGKGIMVADFVLSIGKYIELLTDEDWKRAEKVRPGIQRNAAVFFEYGKRDGYFTSAEFLPSVETALWIFHFTFPTLRLVAIFDRSGVHWKFGDDALNASCLNLRKPGKTLLRDTSFLRNGRRVEQKLTYFDEEEEEEMSRTLEDVLKERKLWVEGMSKDEATSVLQSQPDFESERSLLEKLFHSYGDICLRLPKCHPELNYIELVWAGQKNFLRSLGKTGIVSLRENVRAAREHVKEDPLFLLHCFRKSRDFLHCYSCQEDMSGQAAHSLVKKYKSHRRVARKQLESIRQTQRVVQDKAPS
jgi:hypothetical protein